MRPGSRIIVTGGAGFIGSAFVLAAERAGLAVWVLDRLTYAGKLANLEGTDARRYVSQVDVADPTNVRAMMEIIRPEAVVHFAADSHVDASFESRRSFLRTNAVGTDVVLEAALRAGVARFVHVSTDEVFGDVPEGLLPEVAPMSPRNPYAASKAAAEMVVESFRECLSYPAMMVRLTNYYGPRQHAEKLVPLSISRIVRGEPAIVHSDGRQTRFWLHVEDAALGVLRVLEAGALGETYNLPGIDERRVGDVVREIARLLPSYLPRVLYRGDRMGGTDRRYGLDGAKARTKIGWTPRIGFEVGLADTVRWYLANREWLDVGAACVAAAGAA